MKKVDFNFINELGFTFYTTCFQNCVRARIVFEKSEIELSELVENTEKVFKDNPASDF